MLVKMYKRDSIWYFKDENEVEWSTTLSEALSPLEAIDNPARLKTVRKLKEDGFAVDEIVDLFKVGILK